MAKLTKRGLNRTKLPRSIVSLFPGVTEAFDSDRAVDVEVKKSDITKSKPKDPTECAMAHAFKRETHTDAAIIGLKYSYLIKGKTAFRFRTPGSVRTEIISFDRHGDFEEGHYYLIPPAPSERLGHGKTRSGVKHGPNHEAKRKIHRVAEVRVLESGAE